MSHRLFCAECALTTTYELSLVCVQVFLPPRIVRQLGGFIRIVPHSIPLPRTQADLCYLHALGIKRGVPVSHRKTVRQTSRIRDNTMPQLPAVNLLRSRLFE